MKKIKNYSAQFKIIQRSRPPVQYHPSEIENNKKNLNGILKKLHKQNQEFIDNISASGFKQIFLTKWIYQIL